MKPRVLFISNPANRTGAPLFFYSLMRHIDQTQKWEKAILVRESGELLPHLAALYPTYYSESGRILRYPQSMSIEFSSVEDFYIKFNPDLIYVNTITNGSFIAAAHRLQIPVVLHVQEMKPAFEKHTEGYLSETLSCAFFICVSKAVRDYLQEDYAISTDQLLVVYNGVDPKDIERKLVKHIAQFTRAAWSIPDEALVIGGAGVVALHKGVDLWLQVARRIFVEISDLSPHFVWIGHDRSEYAAEMKRNVKMLGLMDCVRFTGEVSNPYPLMQIMDIFVMSSRFESIGLVNIEAAFLKKAIVCFGCSGGAREVIEPGAGSVIEHLDTYEMAMAVVELARNKHLRQTLGNNAHSRVLSYFDVSKSAKTIEDILKRFI